MWHHSHSDNSIAVTFTEKNHSFNNVFHYLKFRLRVAEKGKKAIRALSIPTGKKENTGEP